MGSGGQWYLILTVASVTVFGLVLAYFANQQSKADQAKRSAAVQAAPAAATPTHTLTHA